MSWKVPIYYINWIFWFSNENQDEFIFFVVLRKYLAVLNYIFNSQVPSPKVVLASTSDMECGFSRDLFAQWCVNGKNTIILTSRAADGTLASDLIRNGGNL